MGDNTIPDVTPSFDLAHVQFFYGEFDGRRPKRVLIKIIGE